MTKTTVLIADDQPLIRDGLASILEMEETYTVVSRTGDGLTAVEQVRSLRPQLVLMDIHMPKLDGLQATRQIRAEFPEIIIIILTTFEDEEYVMEALRYGASGYLVKGMDTQKMLSTIEACLNGRINFPSVIQERLVQTLLSSSAPVEPAGNAGPSIEPPQVELTIGERNLVRLLKQGKSNQAIAAELLLTIGTVKNYLSALYKKLGVANRAEAIVYLHKLESEH